MRKLAIATALLFAAPLVACDSVPSPAQVETVANTPVGDYTILDEKSWYYAESLYNVPAYAYFSANEHGLFVGHDALKASVKAKLQYLNKVRNAVYQAYKAGNAADFATKIQELKTLSEQVNDIIPRQ